MLKVNYKLRLLYVDTLDLYFFRKLFTDFNTGYSFMLLFWKAFKKLLDIIEILSSRYYKH
jgi:hypothetical protein